MIVNIFLVAQVYIYYSKNFNNCGDPQRTKLLMYLLSFPLILVICWSPGTLNRLVELFSKKQVFPLFLITAITISIMGFLNSLVYYLIIGAKNSPFRINNLFEFISSIHDSQNQNQDLIPGNNPNDHI